MSKRDSRILLVFLAVFDGICALIAISPDFRVEALVGALAMTGFLFLSVILGLLEESAAAKRAQRQERSHLTDDDLKRYAKKVAKVGGHAFEFVACLLGAIFLCSIVVNFCGWFIASFGMVAFLLLLIFLFR